MLLVHTPALLLALQALNAIFIGILAGIGMLYFQDLMPGQAGAATTLYTNTTRVGWIIAGSLAGVVAEIWSYHAVFWIALAWVRRHCFACGALKTFKAQSLRNKTGHGRLAIAVICRRSYLQDDRCQRIFASKDRNIILP
jgi:MFS family permease